MEGTPLHHGWALTLSLEERPRARRTLWWTMDRPSCHCKSRRIFLFFFLQLYNLKVTYFLFAYLISHSLPYLFACLLAYLITHLLT